MRESEGDVVEKDRLEKFHDGKKVKDKGVVDNKREFERHSGTGQQAFGNNVKKGGHGTGNVGKVNMKDFEGDVDEMELE